MKILYVRVGSNSEVQVFLILAVGVVPFPTQPRRREFFVKGQECTETCRLITGCGSAYFDPFRKDGDLDSSPGKM